MIPFSVLVPLITAVITGGFGVAGTLLTLRLRRGDPTDDDGWKAALLAKDDTIQLWRDAAMAAQDRFNRLEQSTQRIVNLSVPAVSRQLSAPPEGADDATRSDSPSV